ncbi:hypothetical protein Cgig2_009070 [Carnegiea gigantea]|uniref:Uncharacterized protein n=1 Tax=Carnegiea gigantea TaxID=171969 RepID=A0A9Q1GXR5_9CARY|nr:hypothetical protein Cgig2_009070 [Carnegiea gigantea]
MESMGAFTGGYRRRTGETGGPFDGASSHGRTCAITATLRRSGGRGPGRVLGSGAAAAAAVEEEEEKQESWHPPDRENQRWPLSTGGDWVRLASHWEKMKKNVVIPLYIIELHEACSLQKIIESLDRLNEAKQRAQNEPQAQSQAQNDISPSTEKVILSGNASKSQPKVSSITTNRPNKLLIRRPRPKVAKQSITPLQIDEALHYGSTKSKSSLHDFDVHSLCQSQIGEVDVFASDVEENLGQADDEDSDRDDNEDGDFREWQSDGSEESESFSLDEEDDLEPENESLDDIDLENDTQLRMTFGHGSIDDDVGENLLIVNKITKVFRQDKLWSRNRDGKVSLAVGDIFTSKDDLVECDEGLLCSTWYYFKKNQEH